MSVNLASTLIVGPAGSGKTQRVFEELRQQARVSARSVILLVPTATLAEHLRHQAARQRLGVPPSAITTLYEFAHRFPTDCQLASRAALAIVLEQCLSERTPKLFAPIVQSRAFRNQLLNVIQELSLAGCRPEDLVASLDAATPPPVEALADVYQRLCWRLAAKGLALRGQFLASVCDTVRRAGLAPIKTVLIDGFYRFSPVELNLVRTLALHARVLLTLPDWEGARAAQEELCQAGFRQELLRRIAPPPRVTLIRALNRQQEVAEIARRIIEFARQGIAYREMGVIVRGVEPYTPLIRRTFERFGLPARFYFREPLDRHSLFEILYVGVAAAREAWPWERVIELVGLLGHEQLDHLEQRVLERIPEHVVEDEAWRRSPRKFQSWCQELEALVASAGHEPRAVAEWNQRLEALAALLVPTEIDDQVPFDRSRAWASHAAAWKAFRDTLEELERVSGSEPLDFATYWRLLEQAVQATSYTPPDRRRNVIHVLDAHEARQWRLPVVFVCGLVEGEFPRHVLDDPLLGHESRLWLAQKGWRLRQRPDWEIEEEFLFHTALSRADHQLVVSYPVQDLEGSSLMPAFSLQHVWAGWSPTFAQPVFPQPARSPASEAARPLPQFAEAFRERHKELSVRALEDYIQCPFKFFAEHTLELAPLTTPPGERFSHAVQGELVHWVLRKLTEHPGTDLLSAVEEFAQELCRRERIPETYRKHLILHELAEELAEFVRRYFGPDGSLRLDSSVVGAQAFPSWPQEADVQCEVPFQLQVEPAIELRGRIDRMDVGGGPEQHGVWVVDYKLVHPDSLRDYVRDHGNGLRLQLALYARAAEKLTQMPVRAVAFLAVRAGGGARVIHGLELEELIRTSSNALQQALRKMSEGFVSPEPADPNRCPVCQFREICRVESFAVRARSAQAGQ